MVVVGGGLVDVVVDEVGAVVALRAAAWAARSTYRRARRIASA